MMSSSRASFLEQGTSDYDSTYNNRQPASKLESIKSFCWSTRTRQLLCVSSVWAIILIIVACIVYASSSKSSSSSSNGGIAGGFPGTPWVGDFQAYLGEPSTTPSTPPINLTIGFIADTALTEDTQALYNILREDGIELLVVSGDLDYINNPEGWNALLTSTLGASFPVLTAAGNHDYRIWPRYQQKEIERWQLADLRTCHGYPGVAHVCTWKGVTIVQISPGVFNETNGIYKNVPGLGDFDFVTYIHESFAKYPNNFKICSWHKNQHNMQTGEKRDETGWGVYTQCLSEGAMIMTGHEHSYERSYLMSDLENQKIIDKDAANMRINSTAGFVIVQGLGGRGIRPNYNPKPHWAVEVNSNTTKTAAFSATVCKYNVNGQNNQAYCYTKDTKRRLQDEFMITLST